MGPWRRLDSVLLSGVDQIIAYCIRLGEFGTHLGTIYSLPPQLAALIGCPAMALGPFTAYSGADVTAPLRPRARHSPSVLLLKALLIALLCLFTFPVVLPLGLVGVILRAVMHPFKRDVLHAPGADAATSSAPFGTGEGACPNLLHIFTLNVALSEFEIMNAINGVRLSHLRQREIWAFFTGALRPMPDFFFLQEVFSPAAAQYLQAQFNSIGYHVVTQTKPKSPAGLSSGLFIASRYRVCRTHFAPFVHALGEDALAKKGVLLAEVAVAGGRGIVGTTHLQAAGPHSTRIAQLREVTNEVTAFVELVQREHKPQFVLLAGDFNSSATHPDAALWPFTMAPDAPFRLLTTPTHATVVNTRGRAVLDFAVNVQQQLWVLCPKADLHPTAGATHYDHVLLYALTTYDVQRPTLDGGVDPTSPSRRFDCLDPAVYAKSSEGPIDHVLAFRHPSMAAASAQAVCGVPFGGGGVSSDHLYVFATVTLAGAV